MKVFANEWNNLSWVNFILICIVNALFLRLLRYDAKTKQAVYGQDSNSKLTENAVKGMGTIQAAVAGIVVLSYYIENRATLLHRIERRVSAKNLENQLKDFDYGLNRGSDAYGSRKANMIDIKAREPWTAKLERRLLRLNPVTRVCVNIFKEFVIFFDGVWVDGSHGRNLGYLVVSLYGIRYNLAAAFLLLDIVTKIPQLAQVLAVFNENKIQLLSTLALFVVVLYIWSFVGFQQFPTLYEHANTYGEDGGPDFNMYCRTLQECLMSTANVGIRAGGGVGEALGQPLLTAPGGLYYIRWLFDLFFFLTVNITLMNILFGIIIDSFADKRARAAEEAGERDGQCFICGITKSQFDIMNVSWDKHVYCDHNLHSYIAFLLYVKKRPRSECTGIEKHVKELLKQEEIGFFPVGRCLDIPDGSLPA